MVEEDAKVSNNAILYILVVNSAFAHVLLDLGASHSFISSTFAQKYNFPHVPLEEGLCVSPSTDRKIIMDRKCTTCHITIEHKSS